MADVDDNNPAEGAEADPGKPDPSPPAQSAPAAPEATAEPPENDAAIAGAGEAGDADDTERADGAVVDPGDVDDAGTSEGGEHGGVGEADADAGATGGGRKSKRAGRKGEVAEGDEEDGAADADVPLGALEALLLSTHHPLTAPRLAELLQLKSIRPVRGAVKLLNEQYESGGRSFRIEQVAGGYQILTLPEYGEVLKKLHQKEADARLTKAALETLSIVAYKQPILRADVEAIRGVACGETIRSLMEKHLVKIAGRAEEPGRPILYGTTRRFLELFGLNSLKDLPQPEGTPKPPGGG